jgi:PAS domain S-box-containing protein
MSERLNWKNPMPTKILIIDDSPEDREIIRVHLAEAAKNEEIRISFIECSKGEAGLAAYHSESPDCIILDHHLPDMDGLEFLERLKEGGAGLPVPIVLLTGSDLMSLSADALRAGAQEYVRKRSIGPEVLFRAVQSAQDRFKLFGYRDMPEVWKALILSRAEALSGHADLLASKAALATSREETQANLAELLAGAVALAASEKETRDGLAQLLASAAALSASRAETQDGLSDLVASAEALAASRTEILDGQAELLASEVVNKATRLANALLVAGDAAAREHETQLRVALANRQSELEELVAERTKALVEAEARYRGIFDSQLQFISLLNPDGTIIEMNRTALDAASLHRDEIIGRPFWDINWWSFDQRPSVRVDIALAAAGGLVRREVEIRGYLPQVRGMWIDLSLKPVRDPVTGAVMWIIAESHDLTEKRDLATQLVQAQKMQALGQLAAGIAHDFNNILQVVSGSASLIEKSVDYDKSRRLARLAITAAERGASITQRLLSFSRQGALRAETVETADLLNGVCDVLMHTLGATIIVRSHVEPDVPSMIVDRAQLETAIINLATNARDAMPGGGTITISAAAENFGEEKRRPAGLPSGAYIRLTVSDDGSGMDEETLARVSEPFFTTKPTGKGTGLGVAMVKGFAEQSGGALLISSTLGAGTTVVMWLRQATEIVLRSTTSWDGVRQSIWPLTRILVVDDDDLVREVLAAGLEAEGLDTLVAASGHEALALIEAGERIDVLVSDLSMPGMNGVTTIELARKLRPNLPCFLLTGYVGDGAALSSGNAFTLVRKPITGRHLAAHIEATLEGIKQ